MPSCAVPESPVDVRCTLLARLVEVVDFAMAEGGWREASSS